LYPEHINGSRLGIYRVSLFPASFTMSTFIIL
jgi:hypothetical protein